MTQLLISRALDLVRATQKRLPAEPQRGQCANFPCGTGRMGSETSRFPAFDVELEDSQNSAETDSLPSA